MRIIKLICNQCKNEILEDCEVQDETEFIDKDFCSYKCLYEYAKNHFEEEKEDLLLELRETLSR